MKINVAQLLKQPTGEVRSYVIDDAIRLAEGEPGDRHVEGRIELTRTDRGILLRGALETTVDLVCSRCLTSFEYPLALDIEEEFFPTINVLSGVSVPLPEETAGFAIDEHHMLDLGEMVRQHVLLAAPMKPLCRPECAGICPGCGVNLSQGSCRCAPRHRESPWAELEKLTSARKSE